MADVPIRFLRDCVNPALIVEREDTIDAKVVALHIKAAHTIIAAPPPAVIIDGIRYEPVPA